MSKLERRWRWGWDRKVGKKRQIRNFTPKLLILSLLLGYLTKTLRSITQFSRSITRFSRSITRFSRT